MLELLWYLVCLLTPVDMPVQPVEIILYQEIRFSEDIVFSGLVFPWGVIVYDYPPSPELREAEHAHYDRMRELGACKFFEHYLFDNEWLCEEEYRAHGTYEHRFCNHE